MKANEPVLLRWSEQKDPASVEEFVALGGFGGLKKAVGMSDDAILDEMLAAALMGRGGAAYLTGKKWWQFYAIEGEPKYIVCNADEGEPGTFKDRLLLAQSPLRIIEGMIIAGYLFQSPQGYIYMRGEYSDLQRQFQTALSNAKQAGYLGRSILGIAGFDFSITLVSGAGAYVCGEDSALINSIEGQAGRPRAKPPYPVRSGVRQKPTLVNNVETFACVPVIMEQGGAAFHAMGTEYSGGVKLVSLCGMIKRPGVYEVPLGIPLREIIYGGEYGGGLAGDRALGFCHLGGHSGPVCFPEQLDTSYCYRAVREAGLAIGSGAVVVMDDSVSLVEYLSKVMEFFIHESCGKCTPCRLGLPQLQKQMTELLEGRAGEGAVEELEALADGVAMLSACGLGQSVNRAIKSCLSLRRNVFENLIRTKGGA